MSQNSSMPQTRSGSGRTPTDGVLVVVSVYPVCRLNALRGRQTACSAACRRIRSRLREAEGRQHRDDELRVFARAARQAIRRPRSAAGGPDLTRREGHRPCSSPHGRRKCPASSASSHVANRLPLIAVLFRRAGNSERMRFQTMNSSPARSHWIRPRQTPPSRSTPMALWP